MPLKLQSYAAHVECDGKELEMYDVRMDDEKTTSCWIASESGKEFVVHYADESSATMMRVTLDVDGRRVGGYACQNVPGGVIRGVKEQPGYLRSFLFSPLVITDDEAAASSTHLASEIGTIEVAMTKVDRFIDDQCIHGGVGNVAKIGAIHEKSKKAGVHAVSFGEEKKIAVSKSVTPVGQHKEPFAVFKFRYRPLELLQATGLAPLLAKPKAKKRPSDQQEPSNDPGPSQPKRQRTEAEGDSPEPPVKSEPNSDSEDDTDADDVTFLEEQLVMLEKRLAEKKAKKKAKAPVKREPSPISVPAFSANEIIDLT